MKLTINGEPRDIDAATVAEALADDGISVEVIDPRTLVPLDIEAVIRSVQRTGRLVVAVADHSSHALPRGHHPTRTAQP